MKAIAITFINVFFTGFVFCQTPGFQWAKHFQLSTSLEGHHISVDASGNVYTLGSFSTSNTDFDPGPAVYNLTPNGGDDIFITKYNAAGNFVWAKHLGGIKHDYGTGITVDDLGNVYTTGNFGETADFDPGPGVYNLSCAQAHPDVDIFICKLDMNGNFVWAKRIGGLGIDVSTSITLDEFDNVYTTGIFQSLADFDPGLAIFNLTGDGDEAFISKLDKNGNFIWAKATYGVSGDMKSNCIALDASGNSYIAGTFELTVDFDPGPAIFSLTATPGLANSYVMKLDVNGNFKWAVKLGTTFYVNSHSLVVDAAEKVFVVWGKHLAKLDNNGNELWTKNIGGVFTDYSRSIYKDYNGNIYYTGLFVGGPDFDPGPGEVYLTSFGFGDAFITKLNNNGDFQWVGQIGGVSHDYSYSIFVDSPGNIYSTGSFQATADFDPGPGIYNITSSGRSQYIHKMSWCNNVTSSSITASACNFYILNGQTYTTSGIFTQVIPNTTGCDSIITLNLTINGSTTNFAITSCNSYFWQGQTYTTSGNYSVTYNDSNGCDSILNLDLTINPTLYTLVNAAICEGQNYAGHTTAGTYIDTLVSSSGCDSIRTLNLTIKPRSLSNINATICEGQSYGGHFLPGAYIDTLIAANGCDSIRTLNLTVNPRAFVNVNAAICQGQTYYAGGANQATAGIYRDTLVTTLGCDSIVTTNLKVNPKPKPDLGPDGNLCTNAQASITPGIFKSYLWQDNSTQVDFVVKGIGRYWVTVTDANNCYATDTLNVLSIDSIPSNFLPPNLELCYGKVLKIAVPNYFTYQWSTGSVNNFIDISNFGTYYLTVKDFNNCTGTDSITLRRKDCIYIGIPSAFTPDGDSKNDIFNPVIFQSVKNFTFIVFNRHGQKVFETREYSIGWDGTLNGKPQPSGSYLYHIKYTNIFGTETVENGSVLLIR